MYKWPLWNSTGYSGQSGQFSKKHSLSNGQPLLPFLRNSSHCQETSHFYPSGGILGTGSCGEALQLRANRLSGTGGFCFCRGGSRGGQAGSTAGRMPTLTASGPFPHQPCGCTRTFLFSTEGAQKANIKYSFTASVGSGFYRGFSMSL